MERPQIAPFLNILDKQAPRGRPRRSKIARRHPIAKIKCGILEWVAKSKSKVSLLNMSCRFGICDLRRPFENRQRAQCETVALATLTVSKAADRAVCHRGCRNDIMSSLFFWPGVHNFWSGDVKPLVQICIQITGYASLCCHHHWID